MNIVIPMAGRGSRFIEAAYSFPKPLIDVAGRPMIQVVTDSLNIRGRYIFLVLREHLEQYAIPDLLGRILPLDPVIVVPVDRVTEGAACTALLAREYIDDDQPLVIANSDQYIEWDPRRLTSRGDGAIATFHATHPKWSYVRTQYGMVTEVAEKRPISTDATCGIYYWRRGGAFVRSADQMIAADRRVNGEFYIAPTFNELIAEGAAIVPYPVRSMWGLGTPEDLETFLAH